MRNIVDHNWKLIANEDSTYAELYDIVADACEKKDVKDPHPEIVAQLTQKLSLWKSTLPAKPNPSTFSSLRKSSTQ